MTPEKHAFFDAIMHNDHAALRQLVAEGLDIRAAEEAHEESAIAYALFIHQGPDSDPLPIIQTLLELGADPDWCPPEGAGALWSAATQARLEVVRLLLDHGADVNRVHYEGWERETALDIATRDQWLNKGSSNYPNTAEYQAVIDLLRSRGGKHLGELEDPTQPGSG